MTDDHAVKAVKTDIRETCSTDLVSTLQIAVETFKAGPGLVP